MLQLTPEQWQERWQQAQTSHRRAVVKEQRLWWYLIVHYKAKMVELDPTLDDPMFQLLAHNWHRVSRKDGENSDRIAGLLGELERREASIVAEHKSEVDAIWAFTRQPVVILRKGGAHDPK